MLKDQELVINRRRFFISFGTNEYEQTEYIQLNEEGPYKPTPALFISRLVSGKETTVSMHFEGLPLEVFAWFLNLVNKHWDIDLSSNISN